MRPAQGFLANNDTFCETAQEARHEDARESLLAALEAANFKSDAFLEFLHANTEKVIEYAEAYEAFTDLIAPVDEVHQPEARPEARQDDSVRSTASDVDRHPADTGGGQDGPESV